jgi:hypothetical protein
MWIEDELWEAASDVADAEGHRNTTQVIRQSMRLYKPITETLTGKGITVHDRHVPQRFINALDILRLMEKMVGDDKRQLFELSYKSQLIGLYPQWHQAVKGVDLLRTMLKYAAKVSVLVQDNIDTHQLEGGRTHKVKVGFNLLFEYPVKAVTLTKYRETIIKALKQTDMMEMIIEGEKAKYRKPNGVSDESKEVKETLGSDIPDDLVKEAD